MKREEIQTYLLHAAAEPGSFVLDEQADLLEAAIRREVIEARIAEAREFLFLCDSDSGWQRLSEIEAELAALDKEASHE